jgi:ATP-dependent DNA helicase RecG
MPSIDGRASRVLNAAVVLFGRSERLLPDFPQCRLRVARFRGVDRAEFDDAREFRGHAFELLARAQQFLVDRLPVAGRVVPGLFERADDPLYPPGALREALANAFCHRDYATGGGSVGVAVYDDRVEVTSTGMLHFDLTVDALFQPHESLPWNPLIAHVFYLRGVVEQWGRGIQQMVDLMAHAGLPTPQIEEGAGSVTVRFSAAGYVAPTRVGQDLTPLQRAILEVLAAQGSLPPGEIVGDLPARVFASRTTDPLRQTREALFQLRSFGLVEQRGHGRGSRWFITLIES